MSDYLACLVDPSGFPPRWQCGTGWTAELGWTHILSDLGVWSAYLAIPVVLGYFALRRRNIPFRGVFLLFGAFILLCGTTHLLEACRCRGGTTRPPGPPNRAVAQTPTSGLGPFLTADPAG